MDKSFYNTIGASGQFLMMFDARATSLEDKVMDQFFFTPMKDYTPYEMWIKLKERGYKGPCSSVRRAMSNLTSIDHGSRLEKLDGEDGKPKVMRDGEFNTPNHAWRLNTNK